MALNTTSLLKARKWCIKYRFKHSWIKPEGFDTGIKVYNCITRQKEPLIVKNKHLVTWYTCGPTVYDSSHIGHASCYVKLDIIQRMLRDYFKYNLVTVMNITDIDDKIIKKANQTNTIYKDIAKEYEKEFLTDLKNLGINDPNIVVRVTENIDLVIDFIKKLESNGQAYKSKDDSVYFNVQSVDNYGKLQNIGTPLQQQKSDFKKSSMDFALWKSSTGDEPYWHSPWGSGRPGWHIECSALASHVLGANIDIHAGGIDLRFPHHENEEAQSCAYHKTNQWVNYWLHTGYLHLNQTEKMSKSLGNTISIRDLLKSTNSNVFRLACVMSHYRSNMEYSTEFIETAENLFKVYKNFLNSCEDYKKGYLIAAVNNDILNKVLSDCFDRVHNAVSDDFDTPSVIKILNELVSTTNSMLHATTTTNSENGLSSIIAVSNFISNILSTFGINFKEQATSNSEDFIEVMNILNTFRQEVRLISINGKDNKILEVCDNLRDTLKKCGIVVKDHGKLSSWSR